MSTEPVLEPGTPIPLPPDFPVTFQDPRDAALHWTLATGRDSGMPYPLQHSGPGAWVADGMAATRLRYEAPESGSRTLLINGWPYIARLPLAATPEEFKARAERGAARLKSQGRDLGRLWAEEWLPEVQGHLAYWEDLDLTQRLDRKQLAEILTETDRRGRRLWAIHFDIVMPMHETLKEFADLCGEIFPQDTDVQAEILTAGEETFSVATGAALDELVARVQHTPGIAAALEEPWPTLQARLRLDPGGREFLAALTAFLHTYGKKLQGDLASRSWIDDPTPVLSALRSRRLEEGRSPTVQREGLLARRRLAEARAWTWLSGYPRPVHQEFCLLLDAARAAARISEDHNFYIDQQSIYQFQRVVNKAASDLVEAGQLQEVQDILYLTLPEVLDAVTHPHLDASRLAQGRRQDMDRWSTQSPPRELGTKGGPIPAHPFTSREQPADASTPASKVPGRHLGQPASPGRVTGVARVCRTLADVPALGAGEVLVARFISPSWVPWFSVASAIVTEIGGTLSHAAIVAREFQVPAVVGVPGVMDAVKTGDIVTVDGAQGYVEVSTEGHNPPHTAPA